MEKEICGKKVVFKDFLTRGEDKKIKSQLLLGAKLGENNEINPLSITDNIDKQADMIVQSLVVSVDGKPLGNIDDLTKKEFAELYKIAKSIYEDEGQKKN